MKSPVAPPQTALFPAVAERLRWDDFLTRALETASQRVTQGSVLPTFNRSEFQQELAGFDFEAPRQIEEILSWTISSLERGLVHVTHPRYFGLFNPAPTFPAACADRIAAAFNPQLATATTSPAAVAIESHAIRAVAERAGLPSNAGGHFTSGGSEANYTGLICALTRANERFGLDGARAFAGPPVIYVSRESHLAWLKIAHQAGIGRSAVRLIGTDGCGRMSIEALAAALRDDQKRGCVPVMIAATAGTTNAGMIDPLVPCFEIARANNLWLHVDAAWGGAVIASRRLRGVLEGISEADSITIDAHKWFATTMGCGMFITRHAPVLTAAFHVTTGFMPSNSPGLDPYVTSVQWSRRFLGLRLFLSLAVAGWAGYAEHVERSIALANLLKEGLRVRGWEIVNDSPLAVLCVTPPYGDMKSIVASMLESGRAWVAIAKFEGGDVIRACVSNGETTSDDVAAVIAALEDAASPSAARSTVDPSV